MAKVELEVRVESQPGYCVIHVVGPVDHHQYYKLEEAIQTQLDRKQIRLVVDLSKLTYIVSAGLNVIGHAASQFENVKGKICYVRPAHFAQWQFFTTVGVDQLLPWAGSLEEAVGRVTAP